MFRALWDAEFLGVSSGSKLCAQNISKRLSAVAFIFSINLSTVLKPPELAWAYPDCDYTVLTTGPSYMENYNYVYLSADNFEK